MDFWVVRSILRSSRWGQLTKFNECEIDMFVRIIYKKNTGNKNHMLRNYLKWMIFSRWIFHHKYFEEELINQSWMLPWTSDCRPIELSRWLDSVIPKIDLLPWSFSETITIYTCSFVIIWASQLHQISQESHDFEGIAFLSFGKDCRCFRSQSETDN